MYSNITQGKNYQLLHGREYIMTNAFWVFHILLICYNNKTWETRIYYILLEYNIYIYIYIYIYMYMYVYICVYIYIHIYAYVYIDSIERYI